MSKKGDVSRRFQITKRNGLLISFLLLLSVSMIAFWGTSSAPPPIEFDQVNLNQQITLDVVEELNTFESGESIFVFVYFNVKDLNAEIVFPNHSNRKMFIKDGKDWVEVFEKPTTYLYENVILNRTKCRNALVLDPKLPDLRKPYYLRVYVFGDMTTDEGTIQVAAYTDIMLTP